MKTVWTSGGILFAATLVAMLGAGAIFADAVNTHMFTSAHLMMMSLFATIPVIFWGRKIQLSNHELSFKWYLTLDKISLNQIERVEVVRQGADCYLTIYRANRLAPMACFNLHSYNRAAIKNLLDELKTQNQQICIAIDKNF